MFSGNPLDWSVGYTADAAALLLLGTVDPQNLLTVTHTALCTASVPEESGQLSTLKFGELTATPIMPTTCSISASGSGSIDQYPQSMLFSGGLVQGTQQITITLNYGGKALTTVTPKISKDPIGGAYPTSVAYTVTADGVQKASGTLVPTDSNNSVACNIAATVNVLQIVLTCTGSGIISNCLPQSAAQAKTVPNSAGMLVLDVLGGNLVPLPNHSVIDNKVPSAITITPVWST